MRSFCAAVLVLLFATASPVWAQSPPPPALPTATIAGRVLDQSTGLAIAGARVDSIGPSAQSATTDVNGNFSLASLKLGTYHLAIARQGYQSAISDNVTLLTQGENALVTLVLVAQRTGATNLREIGHTSTRASQSLQRSSVMYQSVSAETMQNLGFFRASDYLQTLPQINLAAGTSGGSDTPSPGDDQYLDFRGIGNLETTTLLDGHPIGAGLNRGKNFGYNWESSPTFALRDIVVTYGSGLSGLSPWSALGGVANMQTFDPTPKNQVNVTQGYGTFSKLATTVSATGQLGWHFGYALAYGTQGIDGPYGGNVSFYQPASAYDQAAPVGSKVYNLGIYPYGTGVANRGAMAKFVYSFGDPAHPSHLTASTVWSAYWDDKTGNGDQDFLPYNTALAMGQSLLASYSPGKPTKPPYTVTNLPNCPKGEFLGFSLNGNPYGFGPNGLPDGGPHCVTPQQYAGFAGGWQGAGTTWQAFHQSQYDLKFDTPTRTGQVVVDTYTNNWFQLYDRTWELPWNRASSVASSSSGLGSGYGPNPYWTSPAVATTGTSITDEIYGRQSDFGIGQAFNNYAYNLQTIGTPASTPIVNDMYSYLQYVYHPQEQPYSIYLNAAEVYASVSNSWAFNPRLALVYNLTHNDVFRVAGGSAVTQPYASQVFTPASLVAPGSLPGNINCTGLTIIGTVGNPTLKPERADDVDVSYGHRFGEDSQIQLEAYSENVNAKIFAEPINVNTLPPGFINTAPYQTVVNSQCGGKPGTGELGVNSQRNIGRLLAQGLDVQGRQRVNRNLFFDYGYSIETSVLKSADTLLLQNNPTYILGAQLPGVPAHKWQVSADGQVGRGVDLRLTQYYVGLNNPKNTTAYNYGEFTASAPVPGGRFNVSITNVWNQYFQWNGLIGYGVPLALNNYATKAQYAPYVGAGATESYGIPPRQIYFAYTYSFKSL
ncbi:MAG: TonB-dependent receptor [Candidatus Eremiobacteraeota bacterium]|nr:TonB-dependent receptor [Candidatus Eremiobacteraeota bacterium]